MESLLVSPYDAIKAALRKIPRRFWIALATVFAFGLLTHLYVYMNNIGIGDANTYYQPNPKETLLYRNRWMLYFTALPNDFLQMPWFLGLATLLIMAVAVWLIFELFNLDSLLTMSLISFAIIAFPTMTSINAHQFSSIGYCLAVLTGVTSVYFLLRVKNTVAAMLLSTLSMFVSASLYEAYICFAASLMVVKLADMVLMGEAGAKKVFFCGLRYAVCFLVGGIALSYLAASFMASLSPAGWIENRGITLESIIGRPVLKTLVKLRHTIWRTGLYYFYPGAFSFVRAADRLAYLLGLAGGLVLAFATGVRQKTLGKIGNLALLGFLAVILPITMNLFEIPRENDNYSVHNIMLFANVIPMVYVYVLMERQLPVLRKKPGAESEGARGEKALKSGRRRQKGLAATLWCLLLCTGVLFYGYWEVANASYLAMHNSYNRSLLVANRIVAEMENTDGYSYNAPVAFVGNGSAFPDERERLYDIVHSMSGTHYMLAFHVNRFIAPFIRQQLGTPLNLVPEAEREAIALLPRVKAMPNFPQNGYVQFIDGVLVVKFE